MNYWLATLTGEEPDAERSVSHLSNITQWKWDKARVLVHIWPPDSVHLSTVLYQTIHVGQL